MFKVIKFESLMHFKTSAEYTDMNTDIPVIYHAYDEDLNGRYIDNFNIQKLQNCRWRHMQPLAKLRLSIRPRFMSKHTSSQIDTMSNIRAVETPGSIALQWSWTWDKLQTYSHWTGGPCPLPGLPKGRWWCTRPVTCYSREGQIIKPTTLLLNKIGLNFFFFFFFWCFFYFIFCDVFFFIFFFFFFCCLFFFFFFFFCWLFCCCFVFAGFFVVVLFWFFFCWRFFFFFFLLEGALGGLPSPAAEAPPWMVPFSALRPGQSRQNRQLHPRAE